MPSDLSIVALLAAGTACWAQIRSGFARLRALLITRTTLHGQVAEATLDYLQHQARVLNWGDKLIRSSSGWVRPLDRVTEVAYEAAPMQPSIAWLNGKPLMFQSPADNRMGNPSNLPETSDLIIITALRGTLDIRELTRAALAHAQLRQSTGKRYFVRQIRGSKRQSSPSYDNSTVHPSHHSGSPVPNGLRPTMKFLHWASADIGAPIPPEPFAAYACSPETTAAREDFERWLKLKLWYQERNIPWRRGHLYYGQPGTGKTALARALAQQADMPVFVFDLSTLSNDDFAREWQNMQEHTPCMGLIEDVDGVFELRVNVLGDQGGGLTFDCLLNALGGIQTADGVFIIVTTNKPDLLDEALGRPIPGTDTTTRPGRLDRAYCLPLPSAQQRDHIIERICGGVHTQDTADTAGMTAAQVTEWAISKALYHTWETAQEPI
jgi:hypothetical protein